VKSSLAVYGCVARLLDEYDFVGTTVVAAPKPQPMVRTAAQTISTVATTNKPSLLGPASRKRAFENEAKQRLAAELKLVSFCSN